MMFSDLIVFKHKCNQLLVCSILITYYRVSFYLRMLLSSSRMTARTGQADQSSFDLPDAFALYQQKVRGSEPFDPNILEPWVLSTELLACNRLYATICPSPTHPFNSESMR